MSKYDAAVKALANKLHSGPPLAEAHMEMRQGHIYSDITQDPVSLALIGRYHDTPGWFDIALYYDLGDAVRALLGEESDDRDS